MVSIPPPITSVSGSEERAHGNGADRARVLVVVRHPVGGIVSYIKYTYGHLASTRYVATLMSPPAESLRSLGDRLHVEVIVVNGKRPWLAMLRGVANALRRRRFEVIHSQGATAGVIASAVNLFFRRPHVITLHETFEDHMFGQKLARVRLKIIEFLFSKADFVNVVSKDAKTNLFSYFPRLKEIESRVKVIPHGVEVKQTSDSPASTPTLHALDGVENDTLLVGYFGRFMPEKGFSVLIDAMEILADRWELAARIRVIAFGWGSYIREYQASIRDKGLSNRFVFVEKLDDVSAVLRQLDLVVIPSLREAFSLIAAEALVAGTPVVASDCIGLRETVQGSPAKLARAGDPQDLASKLKEALTEPMRAAAMRFAKQAQRRFDCKTAASALGALFDEGLRRRGEPAGRH